jgi:ABC-type Mn2+/Zn2+ transport system permease subunit
VALPGIAIALFMKINPFIGAVLFLGFAVLGIWLIQNKTTLSLDTIVGVFFTASLALGALIMPEHELIEALFGNITELTPLESITSIALSTAIIVIILALHKRLALNMVSSDMAQSIGINNKALEFIFLAIFALAVALGIRFVGALLMGSLVIIPAASSKNIARSLRAFLSLSVAFGVSSAVLGIYASRVYGLTPGPVFILLSAVTFLSTFILRQAYFLFSEKEGGQRKKS